LLYVTTRDHQNAVTVQHVLTENRGADGGLYVPLHLPELSKQECSRLLGLSFGQCVAEILNLFFSTKLTAWDVDMTMGRGAVRLREMKYRIQVAELWHNPENSFDRCVYALAKRIHPDGELIGGPSDWAKLGIRISILFGIFADLIRTEQVRFDKTMDVAVPTGDFGLPMAVWYGRRMGLPIGTILCGCNENSAFWELLHRGQVDTHMPVVSTTTPEGDMALPQGMERLICEACGQQEAMSFSFSCDEEGTYAPGAEAMASIRSGVYAAVISRNRVATIIPNMYQSNQYILDPYSALAFGALSDYRARNGSGRTVLMLCEKSPVYCSETVCDAMGITVAELKNLISKQ
jgi:threonine synthase